MALRASTACRTAGSCWLAWKSRASQKLEAKLPGSLTAVRCPNHSKYLASSVSNTMKPFEEGGLITIRLPLVLDRGSWLPYWLPPPPHIPYPSQTRPVETHRWQTGNFSSHLTFRILLTGQSYSFPHVAEVRSLPLTHLHVLQPVFTLDLCLPIR